MDHTTKPIWPWELAGVMREGNSKPDVPVEVVDQVRRILEELVDDGEADKLFVPICPVTGEGIGEWPLPHMIPDPVPCFHCTEMHPLVGLIIGVVYRPTEPD